MKIQEETIIRPLPDDACIAEREEDWGLQLPADYKEFLKKYNGGIPQERSFEYAGHWYAVIRFLGIVENFKDRRDVGWYDIEVVESQIGERLTDSMDLIGMDVVPIAELFAGDYLCLDFRGRADSPIVCIWYHEESGDFEPSLEKVAENFTEFLGKLRKGSEISSY